MKQQNDLNITDMMGDPISEESRDTNCNIELSGPSNDAKLYHRMQTCRMLEAYTMDDRGVAFARPNFLAIEVPFMDAMPCAGFRSFAVMRDPVARLISHMQFYNLSPPKIVQWIKTRQPNEANAYMNGYPVVNCMIIRQLLGRARFIDTRPVDEDDLDQAKKQIDAFDAFVPLEYLHHPNVLRLLNSTVWEYHKGLTKLDVKKNVSPKKEGTRTYDPDFLQQIANENVYDIILYQYMLEKLGITPEWTKACLADSRWWASWETD